MRIAAPVKNENSNHYEAFFENATMGILVTDSSGNIAAINSFALKEFGYAFQELIGKKIEVLIPPRFDNVHVHHREKYLRNPHPRPVHSKKYLFALRKDGSEFPVEVSLGNYHNNGVDYVITFINNISVRKKAEAEIEKLNDELEATVEIRTRDLRETMRQLQISSNKLEEVQAFQKALLDNAGAMIIATDEKGVIKLLNPEAARNTGYQAAEVIDKNTPVLFHDKTEIAAKRIRLLNEFGALIADDFEVLVERSRRNIHEEEQYTFIKKDGTSIPVLLTITAIRSNTGAISGFMGIAIDISDRKKAEEDLRESLKKEKELGELKSGFVSMASHEFRTPLSTVLSSAYLVEKYTNTEDQPKREKHLLQIISSVNMLTDILNDFLSAGRIEEGKLQVRLTRFDIRQLVVSIAGEMKSTLKKQQKIRYHHDGSPDVLLDASLLKHIVMNLVSNAGKFSPPASAIEINTINKDRQLILSVKDHGMGISSDDQQHLMERFFRGANAGNIQGTGLGLHIVSKYAELMNGTVEYKSKLEKGTELVITFND